MQEIPLNKGQVRGGEASEPGKFRAKRASVTSVPRRKSPKPNPLGTGGCRAFSYLSLEKVQQRTRNVVLIFKGSAGTNCCSNSTLGVFSMFQEHHLAIELVCHTL